MHCACRAAARSSTPTTQCCLLTRRRHFFLLSFRSGKGKMRNRRYVLRKGPLVVFGSDNGISKAFRNLPGVEVASVDSLNLLQVRRCSQLDVQYSSTYKCRLLARLSAR